MEKLLILLNILTLSTSLNTGSHSLMLFATYITGETPFPEFSAVVMLDDLQLMYIDSVTWKLVHLKNTTSKYYEDEQIDADYIFQHIYKNMKLKTSNAKNLFNVTDGFQVFQTVAGCELLPNDKPGKLQLWGGFDGQDYDKWTYNMEESNWLITSEQTAFLSKHTYLMSQIENKVREICIKHLQRYLQIEKNTVSRKVKPRVKILRKTLKDSGGEQVTCLATGFYPRHINLSLLRDGQLVEDHRITGGDLLPNGEGTYQIRKSMEISAEERKHDYSCTIAYLGLDNKLNITFDPVNSQQNFHGSVFILVGVVLLVFMLVTAFIISVLILWRKRCDVGQTSGTSPRVDYTAASSEYCVFVKLLV